MTPPRLRVEPPRLALSREEAAAALGMSAGHFDQHVRSEVPVIYVGAKTLFPVEGLREWCQRSQTIGGRRA